MASTMENNTLNSPFAKAMVKERSRRRKAQRGRGAKRVAKQLGKRELSKILHKGTIRGKPLTKKQRGFFGAARGEYGK